VALAPTPGPQGLEFVSQPKNVSAICGENVSFSVAVSGIGPISYQWYFETSPISNQTNSIFNLVNVCTNNAGNYYVVATNPQGCVTSEVATLTIVRGEAPVAQSDNVVSVKNHQLIIPSELLLANDSDPNSSTLSIINVSGSSSSGGSVLLVTNNVIYTPQANYIGIDEFQYTIRNGNGMQAMGVVYVTVAISTNYNNVTLNKDGANFQIKFEGLPGYTYEILRSADLIHWTVIQDVQADTDGQIIFDDTSAPDNLSFYRIRRK